MVKKKAKLLDTEWVESIVGLTMKVPDYWWAGCNGSNLHDGRIVSFDVASQKWNLLLDSKDDDDLYLIAYDAVVEYSNTESSTYSEFHLPYSPVREGDDEVDAPDGTTYRLTPSDDWDRVESNNGRPIDPIEWTGGGGDLLQEV